MLDKLSYAGGIIDGEGWIGVRTHNKRNTYTPGISVNMCDPDAILILQELFGGNICRHSRRKYNPRASDYFSWERGGENCINILKELLPYIVVKKKKAELILSSDWRKYGRRINIPDEERMKRQLIYETLRTR